MFISLSCLSNKVLVTEQKKVVKKLEGTGDQASTYHVGAPFCLSDKEQKVTRPSFHGKPK